MFTYTYMTNSRTRSEQAFLELGTQAHHNPMKMISGHSPKTTAGDLQARTLQKPPQM
jgi:hypothetical protein